MNQANRLRRVFIVFALCFTLGLTSVVSLQLFRSYEATLNAAEVNAANLVKSIAQHAQDTYEELDLTSYGIVERLEWDKFGAGLSDENVARLKHFFKRQVAQMNQVHGIFVYDKDGKWIVTDKDDYPASYMTFYSIGSAAGAFASTAAYGWAGWNGVCVLGAAVSLSALLFWYLTRPR